MYDCSICNRRYCSVSYDTSVQFVGSSAKIRRHIESQRNLQYNSNMNLYRKCGMIKPMTISLQNYYPSELQIVECIETEEKITLKLKSCSHNCICPKCGVITSQCRGIYNRRVQDLPILGQNVELLIHRDYIVKALAKGDCWSNIYCELQKCGLSCSKTPAYDYMNRIAVVYDIEISRNHNCTPMQREQSKQIAKNDYISRKKLFRFLWMDEELNQSLLLYLQNTYLILKILYTCIKEFRHIFKLGY